MTNEETYEKYWRMAGLVTNDQRAKRIEELVMGIENVDDIGNLIDVLAEPVSSPFG